MINMKRLKKIATLKGFRPGKIPREILKRQFGKDNFTEKC